MSPPAIRVLHVLHRLDFGGVESWLLDLLRWSDPGRLRHAFLVHGSPGAWEAAAISAGGRIIRGQHPHRCLAFTASLRAALAEHGPFQVVHSHLHLYSGLVLRIAAKCGVPVRIAHGHTATPDGTGVRRTLYRAVMRRWLRRYATVGLAASQPAMDLLYGGLADRRWQVLHCGIDFRRFTGCRRDPALREALGIPSQARLIGHVGRLVMEKNHGFMLDIAVACPDAWFLFVGDGPRHAELAQAVAALGIAGRVVFAGPRTDIPALLACMDAFLFPSLHEGLGLAMVEAQAAGLPVVHADHLPRDAVVIPELCTALPLAAPAAAWAERLMTIRAPAGCDPRQRLADSCFDLATGFTRLEALYREGA